MSKTTKTWAIVTLTVVSLAATATAIPTTSYAKGARASTVLGGRIHSSAHPRQRLASTTSITKWLHLANPKRVKIPKGETSVQVYVPHTIVAINGEPQF